MTMAGAVRTAATRAPDKIALRHGTITRTYRDFSNRIERIANAAVRDLAIAPGRTAAIFAGNAIEYLEITAGVPEAGVPVATVSAKLTPAELGAVCDDALSEVLFVDRATASIAKAAAFKTVRRIIEIGPEFESWVAEHGDAIARPSIDEWSIWTIPYTSGTTGQPKGVMLSHRARLLSYIVRAGAYGCFGNEDRFLSITPMNHGPGVSFPMNALIFGGFAEIMDRFDPVETLRKLKNEGFTGIYTVPTHFHEIFNLDAATLGRYRRPPIKAIISNSAPLTQSAKVKIVDYFGDGVLNELFSSTENGMMTNLPPADQIRKPGSVGLLFPFVQLKIVADDGRACGPGEIGELFSNSPYHFAGYWNRPIETAAAFKDGWVSVGDMARRDADGHLYIVGRKKEMIITGGVNVYPIEVEELLATHPAVAEAAIIGVPDAKWGEKVVAFVAPKSGAALSLADMTSFCASRLAAYKIPKDIVIVPTLPRNQSGKVMKRELLAQVTTQ